MNIPGLSFLKRAMGQRYEDLASLEYLTTIGFFGDQLALLPETDDEIILLTKKFAQSIVPFLETRKDRRNAKILNYFLLNLEVYEWDLYLLDRMEKRLETIKDTTSMDHRILTEKIASTEVTCWHEKKMLVSEGWIILSNTFPKITGKTIILNKPYILARDSQLPFHDPSKDRKSGKGI